MFKVTPAEKLNWNLFEIFWTLAVSSSYKILVTVPDTSAFPTKENSVTLSPILNLWFVFVVTKVGVTKVVNLEEFSTNFTFIAWL